MLKLRVTGLVTEARVEGTRKRFPYATAWVSTFVDSTVALAYVYYCPIEVQDRKMTSACGLLWRPVQNKGQAAGGSWTNIESQEKVLRRRTFCLARLYHGQRRREKPLSVVFLRFQFSLIFSFLHESLQII